MTYAAHWARCWSLVGAVGVGLSFLMWEPVSVLTVFLTAALCAGILLVLLAPAAGPHSPLPVVRWSRIFARAGLAGAAVVALGALSTALPTVALPLALVALATCPPVVDQLRQWRRSAAGRATDRATDRETGHWTRGNPASAGRGLVHDGPGPNEADEAAGTGSSSGSSPAPAERPLDVTSTAVREMTDAELCREWRHSFVTLQAARLPHELARVVAQRQVYLDEMERRSPTALQAWLESGARAAGGPDRFLTQWRHDDQSDAA